MEWISIKKAIPQSGKIIVAIMQGRQEQNGDHIEDAQIIILRVDDNECRTMDETGIFYFPKGPDRWGNIPPWEETIAYWMDWSSFKWPQEMLITKEIK